MRNKISAAEPDGRLMLHFVFVFFLFVAIACKPAAAQTYTIADLGTLGGSTSQGYAINASGQVTGISSTATNPFGHAFVISPPYTSMTDLGAILADYSWGAGINSSGQITGGSYVVFVTSPPYGSLTNLGNLGGVWGTTGGYGINDSGAITGLSSTSGYTSSDPQHAFVSLPPYTLLTDLGTLPGGDHSGGHAINASGQIVGTSTTANGRHPFLVSPPSYAPMVDLGTLGGGIADGLAINDSGQVTGESFTTIPGQSYHAFLASAPYANMVDLGTLGGTYSSANGINNLGQVVGTSYIASDAAQHAFLYTTPNGMVDLNSTLPNGSGWTLISATAINDSGQITGWGKNSNGDQHAFLLTPQVTSRTPSQMVTDLIATVQALHVLKQGTSLTGQLNQVAFDISTQNGLACGDLAAFANHVRAQDGNKISRAEADQLLAAVASIEAALNCGH